MANLNSDHQSAMNKSPDWDSKLVACAASDPGLPRANPTISFWQEPPQPISTIQSSSLPRKTDVAVIGSGITACSVTKALLEHPSFAEGHVTVLEARTICSGATGRNGGHLVSAAAGEFALLTERLGIEQAKEAARFSINTVKRVQALVADMKCEPREVSELRRVKSVLAFEDEESFQYFKKSLDQFEEALPEYRGLHRLIDGAEARTVYKFRNAVGAVESSQGALWPYRLVCAIYQHMLSEHKNRLTLESSTPVMTIAFNPETATDRYPYVLQTPRGEIRASRVIHCTNAFAGHLLPALRGKIFPLRGTMSTQVQGSDFPNIGAERSWSIRHTGSFDEASGEYCPGLYYMQQNAKTGDIFIGGERQRIDQILTSDDTHVPKIPYDNLTTLLPRIFNEGWKAGEKPQVRRIWSGIMGFTLDSLPMVGKVTEKMSGRSGDQEWIAAGFNGYGMDKCWLTGEALAGMIMGDDVSSWFPQAYRITDDRVDHLHKEAVSQLMKEI